MFKTLFSEIQGYKRRTPENAFSKITEHLNRNKRVHTEFFMVNILLQLERKDGIHFISYAFKFRF